MYGRLMICFCLAMWPFVFMLIEGKSYSRKITSSRLVWQDEFSGTLLNMNTWRYRSLGKRGDGFNDVRSVYLNGKGCLVIKAQLISDSVLVGIIDTETKFEKKYGYFECRAKLTKTNGIWPAFWLQSSRNTDYSKPEKHGAEIDIFEYFRHSFPDKVAHSIHWGGYSSTHQVAGPVWSALAPTPDGFHTFGLEWKSSGYTIYVDGKKQHETAALISHQPQFLILSLEVNKTVAGPLDRGELPDSFVVDYVRVYEHKP